MPDDFGLVGMTFFVMTSGAAGIGGSPLNGWNVFLWHSKLFAQCTHIRSLLQPFGAGNWFLLVG